MCPKEGRKTGLQHIIDGPLMVGLYQNNPVLDENTTYPDLTPCDFNGYTPLDGQWSVPMITACGDAVTTSAELTWTKAAGGVGNTARGYYIYDYVTFKLLIVRAFGAALDFTEDGAEHSRIITMCFNELSCCS